MKLVKGRSLAGIIKEMKEAESGKPPFEKGGFPRTSSPKTSTQKSLEKGFGENLSSERLSPSSLSDLLQVFLKVCDGVAFAHSRGVMHRDLKPANIMVGEYGEVLVMDWGLAKLLGAAEQRDEGRRAGGGKEESARPYAPRGDGKSDAPRPPASPPAGFKSRGRVPQDYPPAGEETRGRREGEGPAPVRTDRQEEGLSPTLDGSTVGTPAYMSPEQANGELDKIDPRSDIYSLGAILYEILTLERAIEGETPMMVLANAARNRIVPIEKRAAGRHVPRELSAIAMKCLPKSRAARYRSVLDLRRDIGLFLEGRSVSAKPDTFAQAVVKLVKRNKPVSAAIAAAAVIVIALTTGFILRVTHERDRARASEQRALDNEGKTLAAQKQQRETALAASKELADQAIRAASEGRMAEADVRADAALRVMPDGPWGHYALATVAHDKKDFPTALKHIEQALACDPAHPPSNLLKTTLLAASGDLAQWEKLAAEAEKSTDWKALVAAGDALYAGQKYAPSVAAYERALSVMEKDRGVPATAVGEVRDRAQRSVACVKTEGFYESVRHLTPEEQAGRIKAMLTQMYGPSSRALVEIESGVVTGINIGGEYPGHPGACVRWLDPLRGIPFKKVWCKYTMATDLTPLRGMPLRELNCSRAPIDDLGPLRGMPLTKLDCSGTRVTDLGPLKGMPLTVLNCAETTVRDLGPLAGLPLKELDCNRSRNVVEIAPLRGLPLEYLDLYFTNVVDLSPLKGMPLRHLNITNCGAVRDLSPLRGAPLTWLAISSTQVTDLTPLEGMKIEELGLSPHQITRGLQIVREMKTIRRLTTYNFWVPTEDFWKKYDAGEFK